MPRSEAEEARLAVQQSTRDQSTGDPHDRRAAQTSADVFHSSSGPVCDSLCVPIHA